MKNRGFILLASIFLVLFLSIFLAFALFRSDMQLRLMDTRQASSQAFYAAEAGINQAVTELRSNPAWPFDFDPGGIGFSDQPFNGTSAGGVSEQLGFYTVQVTTPAGGTRWLLSTGQDADRMVTRFLNVTAAIVNPGSFFVSTLSGITLASGATIGGDLFARDVIFDVNKDLPAAQRTITVNANVSYTRSLIGANDTDVIFGSGNSANKVAPITYTGLDLNRYKELAQLNGRFVDGDFTYSGEVSKGALGTANGLVYVQGDAHIAGNILESMHIVATGNIYVEGNMVAQPSGPIVPQLGLSAGNDVIIPASAPTDLTIEAFVFADGGVFEALGVEKGTLNFNGSISVRGKENVESAINLNAYGNRIYNFNSEFVSNMQIPFMNYFVNVVDWKETGASGS